MERHHPGGDLYDRLTTVRDDLDAIRSALTQSIPSQAAWSAAVRLVEIIDEIETVLDVLNWDNSSTGFQRSHVH